MTPTAKTAKAPAKAAPEAKDAEKLLGVGRQGAWHRGRLGKQG